MPRGRKEQNPQGSGRASQVWYNGRRISVAIVFWRKKQGSSSSRGSVQDDWLARLPQHKHHFYENLVREWEDAYAILSVVLDEALAHRSQGELVRAREGAQTAAAVVNHLGEPLLAAYRTLEVRGRSSVLSTRIFSAEKPPDRMPRGISCCIEFCSGAARGICTSYGLWK